MPEPTPSAPQPKLMTAQERAVWLACHNAPPGMRLVEDSELQKITASLIQLRAANMIHENGSRLLIRLLGDYYLSQSDLPNAVAEVVFDAERFKKAADLAGDYCRRAKYANEAGNPISANLELDGLSKFLQKQNGLRRDRDSIRKLVEKMGGPKGG